MGQQVFTSSGTFTCPPGITQVQVQLWGAGAGGGGAYTSGLLYGGGGGGGGAFEQRNAYPVTPSNNYTVMVGTGGAAGTDGTTPVAGGNGGDSWFNSSSGILAKGGQGGQGATSSGGGTGGQGGQSSSGIGDFGYSGGNGDNGKAGDKGGGGGSSAGTGANGANGTSSAGGIAPSGGGNGGDQGNNGSAPGGGGGGSNGISIGAGANGQVIITWADLPTSLLAPEVQIRSFEVPLWLEWYPQKQPPLASIFKPGFVSRQPSQSVILLPDYWQEWDVYGRSRLGSLYVPTLPQFRQPSQRGEPISGTPEWWEYVRQNYYQPVQLYQAYSMGMASAASSGHTSSAGQVTVAGDTLIAAAFGIGGSFSSLSVVFSDTEGNTWVIPSNGKQFVANQVWCAMAYALNIKGGTSNNQISVSSAPLGNLSIVGAEYRSISNLSQPDGSNGKASSSVTSITGSNLNLHVNDLTVAMFANDTNTNNFNFQSPGGSSQNQQPGGSWITLATQRSGALFGVGQVLFAINQGSPSAPAWSWTGDDNAVLVQMALKAGIITTSAGIGILSSGRMGGIDIGLLSGGRM